MPGCPTQACNRYPAFEPNSKIKKIKSPSSKVYFAYTNSNPAECGVCLGQGRGAVGEKLEKEMKS